MKSIKITLVYFVLVPYFALYAQGIIWGKYDKHPVKELYKKAIELQGDDCTLLALFYLHIPFEQWSGYYDRIGLQKYFNKYNYSKANEFELRRILPLIKTDVERKQNELQKNNYFLLKSSKQLGNYSFDQKGFPFQDYYYEGSFTSIINWISQRLLSNDNMPLYDQYVFPGLIKMQENEAEVLIQENPNRNINVQIIVENLREAYTTNTYYLYTKVLGVATIVQNGNVVISVSPQDEKVWKEAIISSYDSLKNVIRNWKASYKKQVVDAMYTQDIVLGKTSLNRVKNYIGRIKSNVRLASILQWTVTDEIKKSNDGIEQLLRTDRVDLSKFLENKTHANVTMYIKDWRGSRKDRDLTLEILSYDPATKIFTSNLQENGTTKIQHLEGSVGSDELSPFIILNDVDRRGKYYLRMYEENKYCGAGIDSRVGPGYMELTLLKE